MIDRKFLMEENKIRNRKIKPILCVLIEKGLTIPNNKFDSFKNIIIRKIQIDLNHDPHTLLKIIKKNWKKQELTSKKADLIICFVYKYFDLSGFRELLESNLNADEKLEYRNFDKGNFILITYYKTMKKKERSSAVSKSLDNTQEEKLKKLIITSNKLPQVDFDYKNLH